MGSILEVGTGFHPELTGRENTYLNGAILGMKRQEINAKFDEIVAFSGIEKFIDTPVKRYSSGMYVRLAFAVAAHLDPEVLIIDEVLAVGDYEFQQRCMGRIEDISGSGRTVIFVSHDMSAIARLCGRAYWLQGGRVVAEGESEEVVSPLPAGRLRGRCGDRLREGAGRRGTDAFRLLGARVVDRSGETASSVDVREPVGVEMRFEVLGAIEPLFPKIKVGNDRGEVVFNAFDTDERWRVPPDPGTYTCTAWIPPNLLNEGVMSVDVTVASLGAPNLVNHINVPGARQVPRHGPGPRRQRQGPLHRPPARWRPAAPRVDDGVRRTERGYDTAKRTTGSVVSSADA